MKTKSVFLVLLSFFIFSGYSIYMNDSKYTKELKTTKISSHEIEKRNFLHTSKQDYLSTNESPHDLEEYLHKKIVGDPVLYDSLLESFINEYESGSTNRELLNLIKKIDSDELQIMALNLASHENDQSIYLGVEILENQKIIDPGVIQGLNDLLLNEKPNTIMILLDSLKPSIIKNHYNDFAHTLEILSDHDDIKISLLASIVASHTSQNLQDIEKSFHHYYDQNPIKRMLSVVSMATYQGEKQEDISDKLLEKVSDPYELYSIRKIALEKLLYDQSSESEELQEIIDELDGAVITENEKILFAMDDVEK